MTTGTEVPFASEIGSAVEIHDGSQSIEVAAMFEESVVELRHFTNPQRGVVTSLTKGLLGAAAASLGIAFLIFVASYVQVAELRAAQAAQEKAGQPPGEVLLPREGPLRDILATVFLVVGIGGVFVGLARLLDEREPRDFTIGPARDALFNTPGELLPSESFPIVRSTGAAYELLFTANMQGDVTLAGNGGEKIPLAQLVQSGRARPTHDVGGAFAFSLPSGARAKIDLGQNTFLISSVAPPRHYPAAMAIDWRQQSYTGAVMLATMLFLLMVFSIPPDPKSLSLDAFMNDQRFVRFTNNAAEEKADQIPPWLKKQGEADAGTQGQRHKGDEGKMGKETSKNKSGRVAIKGPADNQDVRFAKQAAEQAAKTAGIIGVMSSTEKAHLASMFGRDTALGRDAEDAMGGLLATQLGEANGRGGFGLVDSNKGGGGTGEQTVGLGPLGTVGTRGGPHGAGNDYGRHAGRFTVHRASAPDVMVGTAQVRGALDKDIIRRVIRSHLNEVKFCYETELMKKADLFGRVMIQFTISGVGGVVAAVAQQSTVNNVPVEHCIAQAVRRWEFPKPQDGGIVIVQYPFVLKAAGE